MEHSELFVAAFNALATQVHETAINKGWWDDRNALLRLAKGHSAQLGEFAATVLASNLIALEHSELSEALENVRHHCQPDDKISEFTGEEAELADCVIRIMDHGEARKLRVAEAIVAKMAMNKGRTHKHGGKAC